MNMNVCCYTTSTNTHHHRHICLLTRVHVHLNTNSSSCTGSHSEDHMHTYKCKHTTIQVLQAHMHARVCSQPQTHTNAYTNACPHVQAHPFQSSALNRSISRSICASLSLGDRRFQEDSLAKECREIGRGSRRCRKD